MQELKSVTGLPRVVGLLLTSQLSLLGNRVRGLLSLVLTPRLLGHGRGEHRLHDLVLLLFELYLSVVKATFVL